MSDQTTNPHPTVRGGVPTIIPALERALPPRHQPDTPVNKKFAPAKAPKKRQATNSKGGSNDVPVTPSKTDGP